MKFINCGVADLFVIENEITNKNAYVFQYNMEKFLLESRKYMILDLTKVEYINNSAIKIIVHFALSAKKVNKELVIAGNNPFLKEIFEIVKLKSFLNIFSSCDDALQYFNQLAAINNN